MTARPEFVPTDKANLVLTRTFNAPAALVYKVWTDPYHLAQWWGPHCFTNPVCEVDLRPGGVIRIHMKGPDGRMYPSNGTFKEIVENERLVFTSTYDGEDGVTMLEALNTVTFTEKDGKTVVDPPCAGAQGNRSHGPGARRYGGRLEPEPRKAGNGCRRCGGKRWLTSLLARIA